MTDTTRRAVLATLLAATPILAPAILAPALAAEDPARRILVFGDSQAQGLAAGLIRAFRSDRLVRVLDRSRIGSGLSRTAYDWPAQAALLARTEKATVAVAMFGANDRPPPRNGSAAGEEALHRFTETYAARVAAVAQAFLQARIPLIWVGHPIVRDPAYAEDIALLNEVFADAAASEGATFLPSWEAFRGADGAYAPHGRGIDGQTQRLRADDGVHMTPAGYDVLAALVIAELPQAAAGQGPQG